MKLDSIDSSSPKRRLVRNSEYTSATFLFDLLVSQLRSYRVGMFFVEMLSLFSVSSMTCDKSDHLSHRVVGPRDIYTSATEEQVCIVFKRTRVCALDMQTVPHVSADIFRCRLIPLARGNTYG